MKFHPGGRYAIQANLGNNLSRQFGGAKFLDADEQTFAEGHVHSSYARMIANQIAIANLEGATEQMQLQQDNSILVVLNEKKEMNVVSFV